MKKDYWNQRAASWVSAAVLAGGLTSAVLLFILVRIDQNVDNLTHRLDAVEKTVRGQKY
jgi:hypothetical protein